MKKVLRWLPAIAACALLAACATTTTKPAAVTGHSALEQRAQARWDALLEHKAEIAWTYLTPGYRATVSQSKYAATMNHRPIQWKTAHVNKVDCERPDSCTVYMLVTFTVPMRGASGPNDTGFTPTREHWLQLKGQWYYLPPEDAGKPLKPSR